ncbi:hypothetical protein ACH33A_25825, partial [Escherichia coli]|uniref:hypothetical protein n=1 Tax=Escherichia coli TaxID=562 RepID=UPI00378DA4D4
SFTLGAIPVLFCFDALTERTGQYRNTGARTDRDKGSIFLYYRTERRKSEVLCTDYRPWLGLAWLGLAWLGLAWQHCNILVN